MPLLSLSVGVGSNPKTPTDNDLSYQELLNMMADADASASASAGSPNPIVRAVLPDSDRYSWLDDYYLASNLDAVIAAVKAEVGYDSDESDEESEADPPATTSRARAGASAGSALIGATAAGSATPAAPTLAGATEDRALIKEVQRRTIDALRKALVVAGDSYVSHEVVQYLVRLWTEAREEVKEQREDDEADHDTRTQPPTWEVVLVTTPLLLWAVVVVAAAEVEVVAAAGVFATVAVAKGSATRAGKRGTSPATAPQGETVATGTTVTATAEVLLREQPRNFRRRMETDSMFKVPSATTVDRLSVQEAYIMAASVQPGTWRRRVMLQAELQLVARVWSTMQGEDSIIRWATVSLAYRAPTTVISYICARYYRSSRRRQERGRSL